MDLLKDLVFWEDAGGKLTAVRCVLILAETFEVIPVKGLILPNNICICYFHVLRPVRRGIFGYRKFLFHSAYPS
ncbi:uncharacterized protein METZ01_LOCUS364148 [marine metagenome]|uniref:Uncharacterized protein n=1 Tax=marine metagenome TaxID=408172 RepID=A0A382SN03_9ZZZZ